MTLPSTATSSASRTPRAKRTVLWLVVIVLLLAAGTLGFMEYSERAGSAFFENGRTILKTLSVIGHAIQASDAAAIEKTYAANFHGSTLGLTNLKAGPIADGMHRFTFTGGSNVDRG